VGEAEEREVYLMTSGVEVLTKEGGQQAAQGEREERLWDHKCPVCRGIIYEKKRVLLERTRLDESLCIASIQKASTCRDGGNCAENWIRKLRKEGGDSRGKGNYRWPNSVGSRQLSTRNNK